MIKKSLCFILICISCASWGQSLYDYEELVDESAIKELVELLADDQMEGRATGTVGNSVAEKLIYNKFKSLGLKPYNWAYTQSVPYSDSIVVRNVVGVLPAIHESDEYVIISAHYDHLGKMDGKIYNGADDNASGVAAMLTIAELFSEMRKDGIGPKRNLIFVGFDGKELNMAGSKFFVSQIDIPKKRILCDINLDMIGTDLEPPGKNKEYIIFLGEENLPTQFRGIVSYLAGRKRYQMDLDRTFYGSKDFAKFYFGMSDQIIFSDAGIPAVTFSSGFNDYTYKPTDDVKILNFPLMKKRILLIFNFIERVTKY